MIQADSCHYSLPCLSSQRITGHLLLYFYPDSLPVVEIPHMAIDAVSEGLWLITLDAHKEATGFDPYTQLAILPLFRCKASTRVCNITSCIHHFRERKAFANVTIVPRSSQIEHLSFIAISATHLDQTLGAECRRSNETRSGRMAG